MPTQGKRPRDFSQAAKLAIDIAIGQVEDRPPTPEREGKKRTLVTSGKKGGDRRAEILSPVPAVCGGKRFPAPKGE